MHILLTNDDGIRAPGLAALFQIFKQKHHVSVVAPDREQSATSHRLTIHDPLRAHSFDEKIQGYSINGTPADCVKLAISQLLPQKPDWVISGINPGANTGFNVFYSGTVAAAREAASMWIPAMSVSIGYSSDIDFQGAAKYTSQFLDQFSKQIFPAGTLLNLNFPPCPVSQSKGLKWVRQAIYHLYDQYDSRTDQRKEPYYWLAQEETPRINENVTDFGAIEKKYITITPLRIDTTDDLFFNQMKQWNFDR